MNSALFPFPDQALAMKELRADPASRTLGEREAEDALEAAWDLGQRTAETLWETSDHEWNFREILQKRGIAVRSEHKDNVVGGKRYFSVYETGKDAIELYSVAIGLWAKNNALSYELAENMILGHEFFHFLEAHEIGFASKLVQLPIITIFGYPVGSKGIRALSEVAAHAFTRRYFQLSNPELFPKEA